MSAISNDSIANAIWKSLESKMNAQALTDPQLEEHKKLMTTKLEEKFQEHTELMNKKFAKQNRLTNWSTYLLLLTPVIAAVVNLGLSLGMSSMMMTWIEKAVTRVDEASSSRWDPFGEAPPNTRVFCQYINRTDSDGTVMWDGILSAWNYTQHLYNATK